MRLKVEKNNTQTLTSITVTGSLFLYADPIGPLEAATKQYVDNSYLNLNASNITSGTLATARLPAFTGGDVVSSSGSNILTLTNTGVAAGTYTKVTVDVKGRVRSATSITAADIPNLDWSIITSGKPTTLSGYGITNGVLLSGDSVTGYVSSFQGFNAGNQIVNKWYVDDSIARNTTSGYSVGDITTFPTSTTPPGFLKCDGSLVSKTTYSALYAVIGDTFTPSSGVGGNGKPWQLQYDFNTTQSGLITTWANGGSLPVSIYYAETLVTKNKIYILGGATGNITCSSSVYVANINSDGTISGWSTTTALPSPISYAQAVVTKNRVYLLGGFNDPSFLSSVYTATIDSNGNLGSWNSGTPLPDSLGHAQAIVSNSNLYLIGGYKTASGPSSTVYKAQINADGTLGSWGTTTSLPVNVGYPIAFMTNNKLYVINETVIYMSTVNSDGTLTSWSNVGTIPGVCEGARAIVTRNTVYIIGGEYTTLKRWYDPETKQWDTEVVNVTRDTIYYAPINSDGTLGTWSTSPVSAGSVLVEPIQYFQVAITSSRVYILGGWNNTNGSRSGIQVANFSGGYNDYSGFYNPIPPDPTKFGLPDFSAQDVASKIFHYIKY